MMRRIIIAAAVAAICSVPSTAQDARAVLDTAAEAAGTATITSIQYTAHGFDFLFGQSYEGSRPWPRFNVPRLTVDIDFAAPAIRDDRIRRQGRNPPLGGGNQPIEEQRQIWLASGSFAWNQNGPNATPAGEERDQRPAIDGRLAQIWLTPHGFIKGAMAAQPTARVMTVGEQRKMVIAFTAPTKARFEATLNDQHLIERIETWLHSPVLGDTLYEATGMKGLRVGNAECSPVHANWLVNHGGATAGDMLELIAIAREKVVASSGISLELEWKLIGED